MSNNIENSQELRSKVVVLNTTVNNMCNATSIDDVVNMFITCKDLLIDIYKYNIAKFSQDN